MKKKITIGLLLIVTIYFGFQSLEAKERYKPITISFGYGASYGGFGGFLQVNTPIGLSFHGGIGYFPASVLLDMDWVENEILFNGGLKYYLPLPMERFKLFLDAQYGGLGIEAQQEYTYSYNYYGGSYREEQVTLWGPSLLFGGEVRLGFFAFMFAIGGSYNLTEVNWIDQDIFLTLDLGFGFRF